MTELLINIIGWIGTILLVAAYILVSRDYFNAQSFWYQMMNLLGSGFLVVNTIYFGAYPSTAVNIIWVFIGGYYLWKIRQSSASSSPTS